MNTDTNECNNNEPWFISYIELKDDLPLGFLDWIEGITQNKYTITLPEGDKVNAKIFIDHQQIFDGGSYTNYLINRYNEL